MFWESVSINDFLTGVSLIVASLALYKNWKSSNKAITLTDKQIEDIKRRWAKEKNADVRVTLERSGPPGNYCYHFIIENKGTGIAQHFEVTKIISIDAESSAQLLHPVKDKFQKLLKQKEILPEQKIPVIARCGVNTGYHFDITWKWENENGEEKIRTANVSPIFKN